jgi:hypothetical protein
MQREHWISSQGKPPLIAWSIVGEGSIGSPSLHIRSFQLSQSNLSACWISAAPLARISADCAVRMPVIARAFPNSFVSAFRCPPDSGVGWCFGAIRTSSAAKLGCRLGHVESRPAPVFFVSSSALLAGVVEQSLRDVLPDRVAAIQSDCIGGLDFHGPLAATAGDTQDVAPNFGKTLLPLLGPGRVGARVFEYRFPVFGREGSIRSRRGGAPPSDGFSGQLFHLLWGRHAPARGSVGHFELEHKENKSRVRSSLPVKKSSCWEDRDVGTKLDGSS